MADLEKDEVAYYFNLVVEHHSDVDCYFYLDHCLYSRIRATCAGIKNGHLVARVSLEELDKNPLVWGSEVNAYFSVRDVDVVHCHFKSRLVRMYNAANAMFLIFPLPKNLDHNQRRFSRRVNLFEMEGVELAVWHGEMQGGNMESQPQLRWIALRGQPCSVGEISANGLRLDIEEKSLLAAKIGVNDLVLLKGDFAPKSRPCPIFVLGVAVRKMPDIEAEGIIDVGCHFLNWRKVNDSQNPAWFRADPQEGIGMIAQWVSRNFRSLQV